MKNTFSSRINKRFFILFVFVLLSLLAPGLFGQTAPPGESSGVQYVSPRGSNSNSGLAWDTAKHTIQEAISRLPRQSSFGGHGKVLLAAGVYTISSTLVLPAGTVLEGLAGGSSPTIIRASDSFPKDTPLVTYGTGGAPEGIFLKDLIVDCHDVPGATGVENANAQDNSGLENITIWNCPRYGLHVASSSFGGGQGSLYRDVQILYNASCMNCSTSTVPVQLNAPPRYIEGLIIDARDARVHPEVGVKATSVSTTILSAHCEGVTTCYEIGSGSILRSVDCGSGVPAGAVTTCVGIERGSGIAIFGLIAGGNVTNLLIDRNRNITIPGNAFSLPLYVVGSGGLGRQNIISSYNGIPLKASSFQTNQGQHVALTGVNGVSAGTIKLSNGHASREFARPYRVAPVCTANDSSQDKSVRVSSTRTTLSVSGPGNDVVTWICTPAAN